MARPVRRRAQGTGSVRQLASGRWQARYRTDDDRLTAAPQTFDTKMDASAWLADYDGQTIVKERQQTLRLGEYADQWLAARELRPRTRVEYRRHLDSTILPTLRDVRLTNLSPDRVRTWYGTLDPATPTKRSHAYVLLHGILATALADDLIDANPCRIRGAGKPRKKHQTIIATPDELVAIVEAITPRYRAMILLATWCALRFGELTELRRGDVVIERIEVADAETVARGVLRVRRGVTKTKGAVHIGDPKTPSGIRSVAIPPHLITALEDHLKTHVGPSDDALLFPARSGGNMSGSALNKVWWRARKVAGREDLTFHDLRHTGATMAAAAGATLAELMARLGHKSPAAALRYQHIVAGRDQTIADKLSEFAQSNTAAASDRWSGTRSGDAAQQDLTKVIEVHADEARPGPESGQGAVRDTAPDGHGGHAQVGGGDRDGDQVH